MKKQALHLFSILAVASFLLIAFGSNDDNDSETNKLLAYNYAEDFVKQKLKSPSTAVFPGLLEKNEHIKELGNDEYLINSWVESQNSFGATIRSKFSCKIIFEGENVQCKNLIIE